MWSNRSLVDCWVDYVDRFVDELQLPKSNEEWFSLSHGNSFFCTIRSNSCVRNCKACLSLKISVNCVDNGSFDVDETVEGDDVPVSSNLLVINER